MGVTGNLAFLGSEPRNKTGTDFQPSRRARASKMRDYVTKDATDADFFRDTISVPNQFFDVVLKRHSRGVVRLLAFMFMQHDHTLNGTGELQSIQIPLWYEQLRELAGIGINMIPHVLAEAVEAKLITVLVAGKPNTKGSGATPMVVQLNLDQSQQYKVDPRNFTGFHAGPGNFTMVPRGYLQNIVLGENLAIAKVVGMVIRHTNGWATARGHRQALIPLSVDQIHTLSGIQDRKTAAQAMRAAIAKGYITKVDGYERRFSRRGWGTVSAYRANKRGINSSNEEHLDIATNQSAHTAAAQPIATIPPSNGSINPPLTDRKTYSERIENPTPIKRNRYKQKNPLKQQQEENNENAQDREAVELLLSAGFSLDVAHRLAPYGVNRIRSQINALSVRSVTRNKLGFLRTAIEEDYPLPFSEIPSLQYEAGSDFVRGFYASYGGNAGEATANPSPKECELADSYLRRLRSAVPLRITDEKWGRHFGEWARRNSRIAQLGASAFSLVHRLVGDAYFSKCCRSQERRKQRKTRQATAADETNHKADWMNYLKEREAYFQVNRPKDYRKLQEKLDHERAITRKMGSAEFGKPYLEQLDTEQFRLNLLQELFPQDFLSLQQWNQRRRAHTELERVYHGEITA